MSLTWQNHMSILWDTGIYFSLCVRESRTLVRSMALFLAMMYCVGMEPKADLHGEGKDEQLRMALQMMTIQEVRRKTGEVIGI